jgi:hypothetical protein
MNREIQFVLFAWYLLQVSVLTAYAQKESERIIVISQNQRYTTFQLFAEISRQTGYYFIYDSELVDNDQPVAMRRGEYVLKELLESIIDTDRLEVVFVDQYAVIQKIATSSDGELPATFEMASDFNDGLDTLFEIKGRVVDSRTGEGLSFANIVLNGRGRGVSANADGAFSFKAPLEFIDDTLKITFMGYAPRLIPVRLLTSGSSDIYLDVETVSLLEVVVRSYNPMDVLIRAIIKKPQLYPQRPTLHTSFYRESILKNNNLLNYSEALFEIYKTSSSAKTMDQVRMIKSRNINNIDHTDTLIIKLKAGIQSILELDVVKYPPEFLQIDNLHLFRFPDAGYVKHESDLVYAITFEANSSSPDQNIYEGTIYVNTEDLAIIQVDFGITQAYLRQFQHYFITRRSNKHVSRIRNMNYSVRYAKIDGVYHIQHVRGEIGIRIRDRNRLTGNNYSASFEMAVMNVENENVRRFSRRETLKPNVIFTDQNFDYDIQFWNNMNFILPEKDIIQAMQRFNAEIRGYEPED